LALYSVTLFLSAMLLFSIEPMVGKMILPKCGGTPSVWNTCSVFFQMVVLVGYAYAHFACTRLGIRRQAAIHLGVILLPLLMLPVFFGADANPLPDRDPSLWLFTQLTLVVGLPFFVVSSTAPLLQRWFSATGRTGSQDPYFLYSVSNAGSLLALLGYPFLIEPAIGLVPQSHLWAAGYALLVFLIGCCTLSLWRATRSSPQTEPIARGARIGVPALTGDATGSEKERPPEAGSPTAAKATAGRKLLWVFLAFVPSSLMLGVTTHIATDVASMPMLWVIPLALYLVTFIIAFSRRSWFPQAVLVRVMGYAVLLMPLFILTCPVRFWMAVPLHLSTFFIVALVCHGELARSRPAAEQLTEFYLWMSVGGVLGGMFNSLLATRLFTSVAEYPLMLVAACFLCPSEDNQVKRTALSVADFCWAAGLAALSAALVWTASRLENLPDVVSNMVVFGIPAMICLGFRRRPARFALGVATVFLAVHYHAGMREGSTILAHRDFFGVKRVCAAMDNRFHALVNGNTIHGLQKVHPERSSEPAGYYCRKGPLGEVFAALGAARTSARIAVIGLGTGSIAAYAAPAQRFTFYEIDPSVVEIASDPRLFTFLQECKGRWNVVLGDARLQLAKAADHEFDLIVLDAFSSDSIPMHLLTQEALGLYCRKLNARGLLVLHVSNRYLDLAPVLARLADAGGLVCLSRQDLDVTDQDRHDGKYPSHFMVMARTRGDLGALAEDARWSPAAASEKVRVWTDDYSDIVSALRW